VLFRSKTDDRRKSSNVFESLPQLHHRPGVLQTVTSLRTDINDVEDITYTPQQVWTKQMTSDDLVRARQDRRRQYGWMVDFDDFKMPFQQNIANKLEQMAADELVELQIRKKTAKRK
jgi:hypothetical protein